MPPSGLTPQVSPVAPSPRRREVLAQLVGVVPQPVAGRVRLDPPALRERAEIDDVEAESVDERPGSARSGQPSAAFTSAMSFAASPGSKNSTERATIQYSPEKTFAVPTPSFVSK